MNDEELQAARSVIRQLDDPHSHNSFCEACILFKLYKPLLAHIDQQQATIESLKTAIISDRTELVLYSPDYIVWRYHNDIDKIESQDDWLPLETEAKAQLAREYPEIFGDLK